jgi:acetolactate synthase-1/2/3 large subunit
MSLTVTTLVCANRSYAILHVELLRTGRTSVGRQAMSLTDLANPATDWVRLGRGMGIPGAAVETGEQLGKEMTIALQEPGPHLIEMILR